MERFFYFKHDTNKIHRENGPAVTYSQGSQDWYLDGEKLPVKNNEEFLRLMKIKAFL